MKRGELEKSLVAQGLSIAGVDEVGRGCLAGPVYAAACILDYEKIFALPRKDLSLIRDSKTLTKIKRVEAINIIQPCVKSLSICTATVAEIEEIDILNATFLAMRRALSLTKIEEPFDITIVDGKMPIRQWEGRQHCVIKGDSFVYAIAAASIFAKEARDNYMAEQANIHQGYGFENHVGYGTKAHLEAISKIGICALHRKTFSPISQYI